MEHDNCAFGKVEILPNNIGYVKFDGLMDASFCGPTVVAAMGFVAHTDAIIFDLRQNGGGQPAMVTLIASYLFDKPSRGSLLCSPSSTAMLARSCWSLVAHGAPNECGPSDESGEAPSIQPESGER